jgi:cytosine/adenosine deaminase-related metal-dependent hydrolase
MATLGGAEALGFADLGSLEPGKSAALVHARAAAAVADPLEHVVSTQTRLERVAIAA